MQRFHLERDLQSLLDGQGSSRHRLKLSYVSQSHLACHSSTSQLNSSHQKNAWSGQSHWTPCLHSRSCPFWSYLHTYFRISQWSWQPHKAFTAYTLAHGKFYHCLWILKCLVLCEALLKCIIGQGIFQHEHLKCVMHQYDTRADGDRHLFRCWFHTSLRDFEGVYCRLR